MNNTFDLQRFLLLFKKHTVEHSRSYILSIAVMFGASLLLLEFYAFIGHGILKDSIQAGIFITILLLVGSIYTSLSFSSLGNRQQAINTLTLPASHFEKYFLQWIYTFVIFQLVCVGVFYVADVIVVALNPRGADYREVIKNSVFNIFDLTNGAYGAFVFYFLFHGISFWGALFFNKLHFVKTAFVFFVTAIIIIITSQTLQTFLIGAHISRSLMTFGGISLYDPQHGSKDIDISAGIMLTGVGVLIGVVVLFWVSAFYRLKEKQV
ncbi:MAG: hypothetical protein V4553_18940 [Bacteroidota bacterium]